MNLINNFHKDSLEDCKKKLETTFFIVQTEQPLTSYTKVLELEEIHKFPVDNRYRNWIECGIFINYLEEELADDTLSKLKTIDFLSVIWDGLLDPTVIGAGGDLQYIDTKAPSGSVEVTTNFLVISAVEYAHAQGIVDALDGAFHNIDKMGCNKKNHQIWLYFVSCVCDFQVTT